MKKNPMVGKTKLNLVSKDKINNEQIMVVVFLEQLQRNHNDAKEDGPSPNHICGVLARCKDA
jgi:hypothetical protein